MFNKTTRRNFRQRKESSSEEEDKRENNAEEEQSEAALLKTQLYSGQSRGISWSSKRQEKPATPHSGVKNDGEASDGAEEREKRQQVTDGTQAKTSIVLSFSADKEGNGYNVNIFHLEGCITQVFLERAHIPYVLSLFQF